MLVVCHMIGATRVKIPIWDLEISSRHENFVVVVANIKVCWIFVTLWYVSLILLVFLNSWVIILLDVTHHIAEALLVGVGVGTPVVCMWFVVILGLRMIFIDVLVLVFDIRHVVFAITRALLVCLISKSLDLSMNITLSKVINEERVRLKHLLKLLPQLC